MNKPSPDKLYVIIVRMDDQETNPTLMKSNATGSIVRFSTFLHSLMFVMGFSLVFILVWGGAATVVGQLLAAYKNLLGWIGGIVVILFGLATLRIIHIPWIYYEVKPHWQPGRGGPFLSSLMMGIFFAAGWTPCIGTTLAAILSLGMSQQSASQAMILSSGYALGLGLPFLLLGFGAGEAIRMMAGIKRFIRPIEIASGILLVMVGALMISGQMDRIAAWSLRNGLYIDVTLSETITPTYLIAIFAGLLSFLSPCVLPLVPAYLGYLSGQVVKEADAS